MGVKGLQTFMDHCCPEACVRVNLREMAKQLTSDNNSPTLVVDGMACLRHWYSCEDWVCGGQWREYMDILKRWVEAFTSSGIALVFFFDGVVEEQKRHTWVKRRRRVNGDVHKIFSHIRAYGEQPGLGMFVLPSALATFTRFALKSLGQEVFCSVREADYEIASYARKHNCMGILGQDTDFIIYDSAPYLSVEKLRIDTLTTVLYDRHKLCNALGLKVFQLPLLACFLGNDVVSEERMQHIRKDALAKYRQLNSTPYPGSQQGHIVFAVSDLIRSYSGNPIDVICSSLKLSPADEALLEKGVQSYLLSEPTKHLVSESSDHPVAVYQKYVSSAILQACTEKHVSAAGFMVYSVLSEGVVECSNSLEDEDDSDLLPQALVFKPCRQRTYGLLLLQHGTESDVDLNPPPVKEWFVYPGNPLKEPDMVPPVQLTGPNPRLDVLWFGKEKDVSSLRLQCFLAILDCQDFTDLYGQMEEHLFVALCLVTYIVVQVQSISTEDVDAYLSQAVCLSQKSAAELQQIKLPVLSSRAVQLGCLYVRGLSYLLGANSASGGPLSTHALMPWSSFDGRLFHSKFLLTHRGAEDLLLLDEDASALSVFLHLRNKVKEVCLKKGRELQSRPRPDFAQFREQQTAGEGIHHSADRGGARGERRRQYLHTNRGRPGRGVYPSTHHPHYNSPHHNRGGPSNRGDSRGRFNHRGRYHLAPRWSRPPAP